MSKLPDASCVHIAEPCAHLSPNLRLDMFLMSFDLMPWQEIGRWCWHYCQNADARQEAEALWRATSATYEGVPAQSMMSPQHQVQRGIEPIA